MKTLDKKISSFLFMSALVLGLNTAYASGHDRTEESSNEVYELLGDYLKAQGETSAFTTYTFYNTSAEKVAEYIIENNALNPELNSLLNDSDLLLDGSETKLYLVD
ncbi:hypothetical protein AB9P05_12015 [Roseivirga sp. BDSF3-8]|uniref:hypothetical protein n=1 Tax=Roseivirga sp. BDSF3-8 TaxID=3241598 RepID=UPI003531E304